MQTLLSTAILPPAAYVLAIIRGPLTVIDVHENFVKQTHRNRFSILSSNGKLNLVIPVERNPDSRLVKDRKISYADDWQRKHRQAIISSYHNSPYFEHYGEDFMLRYMTKQTWLMDFNETMLQWIWQVLQIKPAYTYSKQYIESSLNDLRAIDFCLEAFKDHGPNYKQVFSHKFGFTANLSIIDWIFNKGPEVNVEEML